MKQVAIIGASGFIGLRTTELFLKNDSFKVIPIVRKFASLAVLARNQLDWRIADPLDEIALSQSLAGCEVCVHVAIGDPFQIIEMAKVAYRACAKAGVKRLVWMSSASVHGQCPTPGTSEASRIRPHHPLAYNNAKVKAELALEYLQRDGIVQVVRLRPGVVYGPRSRWIYDAAKSILQGKALWLNSGDGIFNGVYVDNLVHSILLAIETSDATGNAFLVGDNEVTYWKDLLLPIAGHLGRDASAFHPAGLRTITVDRMDWRNWLVTRKWYGLIGPHIPGKWKKAIKDATAHQQSTDSQSVQEVHLSREMQLLQQCNWKLPNEKAQRILGYNPPVTFRQGVAFSLDWLDFIGLTKR